jgi:hypothetical protein
MQDWDEKTMIMLESEDGELISIGGIEGSRNLFAICPLCEIPSYGHEIIFGG